MKAISYQKDAFGFLAALLFATIAVVLFSPPNVVRLFIVLGQSHFLLAYLYQWRAGKMTTPYLSLYVVLATVFFYTGIFFGFSGWLVVFTGTLFAAHFFIDEFRMAQLPFSIGRAGIGAAFIAPYLAILTNAFIGFNALFETFFISVLFLCVGAALVSLQHPWTRTDFFMVIAAGSSFFLLSMPPPPEYLLGFIILFHYIRWYFYYFFCLEHNLSRRRTYMQHVILINIAVFVLYFIYGFSFFRWNNTGFFEYFFDPNFFYLWTVLHIFFSYIPLVRMFSLGSGKSAVTASAS